MTVNTGRAAAVLSFNSAGFLEGLPRGQMLEDGEWGAGVIATDQCVTVRSGALKLAGGAGQR